MGLLDIMKEVSDQTNKAGSPTLWLFGQVTAISPLKVRVDNRFDIGEEQLVVMEQFRPGYHPTHTHTIDPHDHTVPTHTTQPAGDGPHSHSVNPFKTEKTGLTTNPEVNIGLKVGDKVVLLRNAGGQQFLILGRV